MKVTKTIREYIEKQVYDKAYGSEELKKLEQEKDKAVKNFLEDKKKCEEVLQGYVDDLVKKYQLDTSRVFCPCVRFHGCYEEDLPEYVAHRKALADVNIKAKQAVLDIIVELEMGGTKEELMDKLNALQF